MSRASVALVLMLALAACGDDDATETDAGPDATVQDGGDGGGFIPRRDSSVPMGDPIPDCDPTDPLACGAGQKCEWVLRFVSATSATVYTGCVDERAERERGVPCEQWGRLYETDGLAEETYVDPCDEGLFCAPDPTLRNVYSCQPECARSSDCESTEYCAGTPISSTILVPVCQPSDDCDAIAQTGCASGEACYLRSNGTADGALSVCFPFVAQPPRDGSPGSVCEYINECQAGSVCWGNPRITPDLWSATDFLCREICDPALTPSDADAGTDPQCGGGTCVWLADPALGLNTSALTTVPGICD